MGADLAVGVSFALSPNSSVKVCMQQGEEVSTLRRVPKQQFLGRDTATGVDAHRDGGCGATLKSQREEGGSHIIIRGSHST